MFLKQFVLLILLLTLAITAAAQNEADTVSSLPGIEITTSVDLAEAYIGDLITYSVVITYDTTYELIPSPLGANLGAFDVKDYEPDIETILDDGRIMNRTTFVLSTFTTGDYIIPPLPIGFRLPDSSLKAILAEPVPIRIVSLLESESDSLDIRALKKPYEFPRNYTYYYVWGSLAAIVLAGGFFLWWWWRRRKKVADAVDLRPPWEIALERLAFLKESDLILKGEYKTFYLELTEITRGYLGRMYNSDVLEMTTEQLLDCFSEVPLPENLYEQLSAYFKHADMVKFARYVPENERTAGDFDFTHTMIEKVRVDTERRREIQGPLDDLTGESPKRAEESIG